MDKTEKLISFLKDVCSGAVEITSCGDLAVLSRFSCDQRKAYEYSADFHMKTAATSGIIMRFKTTASDVVIKGKINKGSSRRFYYFDTYVNGVLYHHGGSDFVEDDFSYEYRADINSLDYCDNKDHSSKTVEIYFPQMACATVEDVIIGGVSVTDNGCNWSPVACDTLKAVFYGDSITQGYDALHPSYTYPAIVSRRFGLDFVNKGIGGDKHNPDVLYADGFVPDAVFTAYGTNDWNGRPSSEEFCKNIDGYFERLSAIYPSTPIFAITPVWRRDGDRTTASGTYSDATQKLCDIASKYKLVTLLEGVDMVARPEDHFSDKRLHPNDLGFFVYADRLCDALLKCQNVFCRELAARFSFCR